MTTDEKMIIIHRWNYKFYIHYNYNGIYISLLATEFIHETTPTFTSRDLAVRQAYYMTMTRIWNKVVWIEQGGIQ